MTFTAFLNYNETLPDWLHFDPAQLRFFGQQAPSKGTFNIRLVANNSETSSTQIVITITREPIHVYLSSQNLVFEINKPFSFELILSDPNKDEIEQRISLINGDPLPEWIHYDEITLTFNGVAPAEQELTIRVYVSDGVFEETMQFPVKFVPASEVSMNILDQIVYIEDMKTAWHIPREFFKHENMKFVKVSGPNDEDIPSWLTPVYPERQLIITQHNNNSLPVPLKLTFESDGVQESVVFNLTVRNVQYIFQTIVHDFNIEDTAVNPTFEQLLLTDRSILTIWKDNKNLIYGKVLSLRGEVLNETFVIVNKTDLKETLSFHSAKFITSSEILLFYQWSQNNENFGLNATIYKLQVPESAQEINLLDKEHTSVRIIDHPSDKQLIITAIKNSDPPMALRSVYGKFDLQSREFSRIGNFDHQDIFIDNSYKALQIYNFTTLFYKCSNAIYLNTFKYPNLDMGSFSIMPAQQSSVITSCDVLILPEKKLFITWSENHIVDTKTTCSIYSTIFDLSSNVQGPITLLKSYYFEKTKFMVQAMFIPSGEIGVFWEAQESMVHMHPDIGVSILSPDGQLQRSEVDILRDYGGVLNRTVKIIPLENQKLLLTWVFNSTQSISLPYSIKSSVVSTKLYRNTVPDVLNTISDHETVGGDDSYFSFSNSLFVDYDGDPLTYYATLIKDDGPYLLPDWLTFDPFTLTFYARTKVSDTGIYKILVTARDPYHATVSTEFTLKVKSDPARYIFGFFFLFSLLLALIIMIKDLLIDRMREDQEEENSQELTEEQDSGDAYEEVPSSDMSMKREEIENLLGQFTDKIPKMFLCPITGEIMSDPWVVVSSDQNSCHSYEGEAIQHWFQNHDTDPLTRSKKKSLGRNLSLKHAIELYLTQISTEDLKSDPALRAEVERWITRRGGEEKLLEDSLLKCVVEKVREARQAGEANTKGQMEGIKEGNSHEQDSLDQSEQVVLLPSAPSNEGDRKDGELDSEVL